LLDLVKTQYRFRNYCSPSRKVITSLLISVVIVLLVVRMAVSADIINPDAPEGADPTPTVIIPAEPIPDAEKNSSMEELVPAPGEELDSGQATATPLVVVPPPDRPSQRYFLSSFKLPTQLTFAGVSVPMDNWQVRERIEYEFYQFLAEEGESIIMAKRTGRCFPPVERQLAQSGLPDDLKYMLLVESKCISAAFSKAKASGPWQFIGSTGKRYKLYSNQWRDDRRNLEMSTEAAIKYLRYLKQDLGDWFLAMAAYNAGEDRIRKLLKEQRITDYWKLHYVRETMRYVPRIIAAKEIYSQPEKYLGLTKKDLYAQLETETVAVTIKEAQRHLASIAQDYGSYFLELKMLNPEIRKESLPKGTHSLRVPKQACPFRCLKQDTTP
jgi:membrane-bound lytic murein transglycosylase D